MNDPKRMRDQEDLPEALRDALNSLEQRGPSADTVARVQRSLGSLPASAASSTAIGLGWGTAVLGAAVATVAAVTWIALSREPAPVPASKPEAVPATQASPATTQAEPAAQGAPAKPASPLVQPEARPHASAIEPAARRAAPHGSARGIVASPRIERPAPAPAPRSTAGAPTAPLAPSTTAQPLHEAKTVVAAPAPAEPRAEEKTSEQPAPAVQPPLPEPEDEASLLYRAKRIARTDPATALRMIDAHALHFPSGAYVEEREVLAIDLHRRLGHDAEAKRRAARFLERFPHSVYRNAVTQ